MDVFVPADASDDTSVENNRPLGALLWRTTTARCLLGAAPLGANFIAGCPEAVNEVKKSV